MTGAEKISRLIDLLEGGSAKRFADRCGIDPAVVSKLRRGWGNPSFYYPRILKAYPDVREEWLRDDKGKPLRSMEERGSLEKKIDAWGKDVAELKKMVARLTLIVEEMRGEDGKVSTKVSTPPL